MAGMGGEPLRVILNDRCLHGPCTGVGHYVAQLLAALSRQEPGIKVLPFYQRCCRRRLRSGWPATVVQGRSPRRWPWWLRRIAQDTYQAAFEAVGLISGCRLYHEPNHIPGPWPGPVVTTIHDLSVLRYPQWHPADRVQWYEEELLAALPRSHRFVTVSEFSKREMVELLGLPAGRITPIPLAPRVVFHPRPPDEVATWLAAHGLPAAYVLYVGTIEPRKNVAGLLAAYARLSPEWRRRVALVIAGASAAWARADLGEMIQRFGLSGQVRVIGYLDDEALARVYAGARALVWPTLYEGFGLPPLECMATGTPVITSNLCSLPEVVGDAGVLVDPHDVEDIAAAIRRILEDRDWANSLSAKGLARARVFSWSRCAAEHAAVYRELADE